jgi:hypothetical protein
MSGIDVQAWRAAVIEDRRVGYYGRRVAQVLARNFHNGRAQISAERIADQAEITDAKAVRTAVNRLREHGWITVEKTPDANHRGAACDIVRR